ncbi:MAG TPA: DctP family TRAP transporter solute-binding subunit [Desulfobacterales bacterium]|nr:DctP family TRAP transporter solute-binding subunit [Desulfobacterales bacterium]
MSKLNLFLFFCLATLTLSNVTSAKEEYVIKYSHVAVADPMVQSSSAYAVVFKSQLEKLSGGRIRVDIYPNGQLGNLRSSVQQVRKGTIQMADISSGILASLYYPELEILDMPYLYSSRTTARMALDNQNPFIRKMIEDCAKQTDIRILSLAPFGFRHMTNNVRPIRKPEDMEGLKIRTMEIVPHMKLMESLGATAMPIPWMELYTSLQTKVVDGEETTLQNIMMGKFYQVQKHLTLTQHVMGIGAFLCNEKWYQSLPDDLKRALIEAEKIARLTYDGFGELLDTMALEKLKKHGMEVFVPTPQELQKFKDKSQPYLREWMEKKYGKKLVSDFLVTIEQVEHKLKKQTESTIKRKKKK